MKNLFLLWIFFCLTSVAIAQQSGVVLKSGFQWNQPVRSSRLLSSAQRGHGFGIEIRLGAEDPMYFVVGASYARFNIDYGFNSKHFQIQDGFGLLKALCGVETRVLQYKKLNWRLGLDGTLNYVSDVIGDVLFEDLASGFLGLRLQSGVDIHFVSVDFSAEYGFSDLLPANSDSKPLIFAVELGVNFR